ncbi:signal peptidase I [Dubosiella newyorkensis]|jgi:signal peptidase I|uniref:Signal peptidase I n=1 Tax=Dubosiella newyorkensis TaxID=1862672 RepID=A0A1U7NNK8_9FIRM|nr:signal peptidase I [Dubosiella newyorkensis]MCI9041188.1 signal peptidase I [Dubosiella newyorkensis]OLU46921.1 signal peptidase I [Dubosiella newyorkensis]
MEKENKTSLSKEILDFVKVFAISAVIVLLFANFIAHPVTVVGHSMDPTLADGEYGFTSIISTKLSDPKRNQIVVVTMNDPNTNEKSEWVKRIIGMPGETIECVNDTILINGEPIDETSYIDQDYKQSIIDQYGYFNKTVQKSDELNGMSVVRDWGPITLGEDEYFVMGDNRTFSKDSRDPEVGPVKRSQIYGNGVFVLYPFSKFGLK